MSDKAKGRPRSRSTGTDPLLSQKQNSESNYGSTAAGHSTDAPKHHRVWSQHDSLLPSHVVGSEESQQSASIPQNNAPTSFRSTKGNLFQYFIYAAINVVIGIPGLYGYAAVIFNHPVFQPHMNALSKLVLFSSFLHQLGFTFFSSLPFAIGTVQDAGLIFLSGMSNAIAEKLLAEGASDKEVLSTTLVLLSGGTASLGLVLIAMGYFKLANAVSYLPMPVVGGYLAFIGYFCLQAGVALCISESMSSVVDWKYLFDWENATLAFPGLASAVIFTYISRKSSNPAALPIAMISVPAVFYIIIFASGLGLGGARENGWVGETAPSVPVSELFHLVDFSLVHWSCVQDILLTWVGMVFVVSFASCLDVAAISMDMGEALDTNKELATVGIGNVMSGLGFGFTGSYIFSQTIFTYRTGVHSRWIGVLVMVAYLYVVTSPVNILQVSPLFFLGSTLIFIGYDLLFEWLIEIRHKIFLSEYAIVLATFVAIQIVGMDAGIVIGVLVSLVDHVVTSASTTTVTRVLKKSRAVWSREEFKFLDDQAYNPQFPRIIVLDIAGTVFFGSSLQLFQRLIEEANIDVTMDNENDSESHLKSPHTSSVILTQYATPAQSTRVPRRSGPARRPPQFVVLDLTQLSGLDASACRGCFLQFAKVCAKRGIVVCASGPTPRADWMLRSHDACYSIEEENKMKGLFQAKQSTPLQPSARNHQSEETPQLERILLFLTTLEALEFCEVALLQKSQVDAVHATPLQKRIRRGEVLSLPTIFKAIIGATEKQESILKALDDGRYHDEASYKTGGVIFQKDVHADAFFIVLKGSVAVAVEPSESGRSVYKSRKRIITGAGPVQLDEGLHSRLSKIGMYVSSVWPVGGVFGFVDMLLQRPRVFRAVAASDDTVCAKITHSQLNLIQKENTELNGLVQKVLLEASLSDLANCTCSE